MALFRLVLNFITPPSGTWSEVYYRDVASLSDAATLPVGVLSSRLKLMHAVNTLIDMRVSDVLNPRVTTQPAFNRTGTAPAAANEGPANLTESAVFALNALAVPARRKLWLRGMAEDDIYRDPTTGATVFQPGFLTRCRAFLKQISNGSFVIAVRQKPPAGGLIKATITKVDGSTNPGSTILTLTVASGAAVGDKVVINRVNAKDFPGMAGIHTVLAVDNVLKTLTIPYRTPLDSTLVANQGSYLYKLVYLNGAVIDYAASDVSYLGSRQAKNVATRSRGARRAKKLRQSD